MINKTNVQRFINQCFIVQIIVEFLNISL